MFLCRIVVHILRWKIRVSSHVMSCHVSCNVMCDLRHHVHDPVHVAAAVELHRVVRDGAVLGPLQQRHGRLFKSQISPFILVLQLTFNIYQYKYLENEVEKNGGGPFVPNIPMYSLCQHIYSERNSSNTHKISS